MEYMSCFYALDYYSVQGELTVIAISFSFAFSAVGFFWIYRGLRNLCNFVFPRVAVGFARIYRNHHYRCNFVLLRAVVGFVGICRRLSACFGVFPCLPNFLRSKGQSEEKKRILYFDENVNWMESKEVLIHMFRVASTRSCVILSIFLYLISCLSFCGRKFPRANLYTQDICGKCSPVYRNHHITLSEGIDSLTFYVLFLL